MTSMTSVRDKTRKTMRRLPPLFLPPPCCWNQGTVVTTMHVFASYEHGGHVLAFDCTNSDRCDNRTPLLPPVVPDVNSRRALASDTPEKSSGIIQIVYLPFFFMIVTLVEISSAIIVRMIRHSRDELRNVRGYGPMTTMRSIHKMNGLGRHLLISRTVEQYRNMTDVFL